MGAIYTAEVKLWKPDGQGGGSVVTEYLASANYNTKAGDTPAHQHFRDTLLTPVNFQRDMFGAGQTTGDGTIGYGEIVVINADGRYDYWADCAFSGRDVIIKAILTDERGWPRTTYASTPILLKGKIDTIDLTDAFTKIQIKMYDRMSDLDKPLLTTRYLGTTLAGGQGAEGGADLKDQFKPRLYGLKHNITPVLVNAFDLIYQISDKPIGSTQVYDGGVQLTYTQDYATVAALAASTPGAGKWASCVNLGLFKLGGPPQFAVTCDSRSVGAVDCATLAYQILLDAGFTAGYANEDIDKATTDLLYNKVYNYPAGYWINDDRTIKTCCSTILKSVGGWILANSQGRIQFGRLELPSGTPIAAFKEWMVKESSKLQRLSPSDSNRGIPVYKVTVRYDQLLTVQNKADLAGAVSADRVAALGNEWKSAVAQDDNVKAIYLQSPEMTFDTCLVQAADATAEAQRLLTIYKAMRSIWRLKVDNSTVDFRADQSQGSPLGLLIDLGSIVTLQAERFLPTPKLFLVLSRTDDCETNSIQFDLWG